jgi:hypothetical protein
MARSLTTAAGWAVGVGTAVVSLALLPGAVGLRLTPLTVVVLLVVCAAVGRVVSLCLFATASPRSAPVSHPEARPVERRAPARVPTRTVALAGLTAGRARRGAAGGRALADGPGKGGDGASGRAEASTEAPAPAARPTAARPQAGRSPEDAVTRFVVLALPVVMLVIVAVFLRR